MSEDAQRAWIENFLINRLAADYPTAKFQPENTKFEPPQGAAYISAMILAGDGKAAELGGRRFERHVGVLQVDILYPENEGTGVPTRMGDYICGLFKQNQQLLADDSVLTFRVGAHRSLGVSAELYRRSCRIPYWRDDRKPA